MKRILALALALILCVGCACADWICTTCDHTWPDSYEYCDECGFEAPLHNVTVRMSGVNFLWLQWSGNPRGSVSLFVSPAGMNAWDTVADNVTANQYKIEGLQPDTVYDVAVLPWVGDMVTISGRTGSYVTPTPTPTPTPTQTPEPTPTFKPTATHKPVTVNDTISFGHYPQTASGTDNMPIRWIVMKV